MTDSSSSRESTPLNKEATPFLLSNIDNIQLDTITDETILSLLQKEINLQVEMEAVQTQIKELEKGTNKEEEEEDQDLDEFEAPQWCIPIKANVMTYDWDVSLIFKIKKTTCCLYIIISL